MRCKNCGTYNDDNRYICETCGSPLYDEGEIIADDKTQTFTPVDNDLTNNEPEDTNPQNAPSASNNGNGANNGGNNDNKQSDKKNIIVIAILVVVLIAVITSVIVVAQGRSKEKESTTISTTASTTAEKEESTRKYTTEKTTEKTTAPTTKPTTTEAEKWYINVSSSGGGTVSGGGEFTNGDKVTLTATPDSGYEFDGWYSSGMKVSNSPTYTFTANENISYSAVFNPVETTTTIEEPTVEE